MSGAPTVALPGRAFVRLEDDGEFGLYLPIDPPDGPGFAAPRWFRNQDMAIDGNEAACAKAIDEAIYGRML